MPARLTSEIGRLDFSYEHSPTKILANRNCQEIQLAGLTVGPFEEGNEYEVAYWIAKELEKVGIARIREEEPLDATRLYKIQWTERVQAAGQISKLPENFYPKLRRFFAELKDEGAKSPEKVMEYEKATHVMRDIVNARLKKIISLSSAQSQTEQVLNNLTKEERLLYDRLYRFIHEWREQITNYKEAKE